MFGKKQNPPMNKYWLREKTKIKLSEYSEYEYLFSHNYARNWIYQSFLSLLNDRWKIVFVIILICITSFIHEVKHLVYVHFAWLVENKIQNNTFSLDLNIVLNGEKLN